MLTQLLTMTQPHKFPFLGVAGQHGLDHLAEEVSRQVLLQHPALRDKVEQILAVGRPLQHKDERVAALEKVEQLDDAGHRLKRKFMSLSHGLE